MQSEAGPSRLRVSPPAPANSTDARTSGDQEEEDEDEDVMDLTTLTSFAERVQLGPSGTDDDGKGSSRPKIVIPKRGEKDFEPLQETVHLQEMMLDKSRQALFGALMGVRGGVIKTISHAVLHPNSPYPRIVVARGHLLDTLGISVTREDPSDSRGKATSVELLPEEALYLLERGSLQIWKLHETSRYDFTIGTWDEESQAITGGLEMSVMEGFGSFLGRDDLTWERYQAYAYLKRLGYTVQRCRRHIPHRFLSNARRKPLAGESDSPLPPFRTWWLSIPSWIATLARRFGPPSLFSPFFNLFGFVRRRFTHLSYGRIAFAGTLLHGWYGMTYDNLLTDLKMPADKRGWKTVDTTTPQASQAQMSTVSSDASSSNPYLPFFHVWKPARPWSKVKWDKGTSTGLRYFPPDFAVAVINARVTPMPTDRQLAEAFEEIPEDRNTPRQGPQYRSTPRRPPNTASNRPISKSIGAIRAGDRGLVVAVNDSGNTGWVRFGRTDFED